MPYHGLLAVAAVNHAAPKILVEKGLSCKQVYFSLVSALHAGLHLAVLKSIPTPAMWHKVA